MALTLLLGFAFTVLTSYAVSHKEIREGILSTELPLTSDNIYSEIQKDLVRPILISSMMARDTFVRDWAIGGEHDVSRMNRYLQEVSTHYNTFNSFFVSDASHNYYYPKGVLKKIEEKQARDAWYFRVRNMQEAYEINVDYDQAHQDRLAIFINYRVFDYDNHFIGATGVGLAADNVTDLISTYQKRYGREIYFVDTAGRVTMAGESVHTVKPGTQLQNVEGLKTILAAALANKQKSFEYRQDGRLHLLNVRYISELKWYLFVAKETDSAFSNIRHALFINLAICLLVTVIVLVVFIRGFGRYQRQLEALATTDPLTKLYNRRAYAQHLNRSMREGKRSGSPLSLVMMDLDHFKQFNDTHGHNKGDTLLQQVAQTLQNNLRTTDMICRWGGEEFSVILKDSPLQQATEVAEKLRQAITEECGAGVTASFGVAQLDLGGPDASAESLLGRADAALYAAKQAGRNCVKQT
ncbi:sensor domain-containing diguanylate cyclase [Uliginosibacterium gangwonense]|uniref:sensor domain-containing diguanylate cyclase n=1 Tax=Uliginosibacterium gangwonense TaxID=392736 RepID=UPI0003AA9C71|nr:sensor domain-containing diguanylate cyclase [Uliginosibacterium gangwonense]